MGDLHSIGGSTRRALMLRAAGTSIFLSLLFIFVYGFTNWLTAKRSPASIGTWYFEWELWLIPYVPLLIVPYMSMDLLFFGASFLCRDEQELGVFAKRVLFVILVAGAFFLLMPLKLAWPPRPQISGWFGSFVEQSCTVPFLMEYPHNLFPTLHISLCLIVADVYQRHTRGNLRRFLIGWFVLIGLSTVLTWQHHVVDVAGGLLLAAYAFYFFRESRPSPKSMPNRLIGTYYMIGSASFLALMPAIWPWGVFLLWPVIALSLVAASYFGIGPGVFRKANGQLPFSARVVLAPVLIGQYLSLAYYRRQCRPWDSVTEKVLIGRVLNEAEAQSAIHAGVTAVLDLTAEFTTPTAFRTVTYRNIPVLDLTAPTAEQLHEAVSFITTEAGTGIVYVHCKIGYSRSAAIVGAYLLSTHEVNSAEEAVERLKAVRPSIVVRPEAMEVLREFECWERRAHRVLQTR